MYYKRLMRFMPNERKIQLQKVIDTLRIGGRNEKTISNYVHAINRFFEYFYIVTTIPVELNEIVLYNQKECYNILFKATSESILQVTKDTKWLGAKVGIPSVLHTW
ncbi:MAG: hypothetical protein J6J60_06645 [Clostridia bacterium]|nr:hypothetical protein [Clostridia bacterium]